MKKSTVIITTCMMVLFGVGMLSGCSNQDNVDNAEVKDAKIFVAGNHANSQELPLNDVDTYNLIYKVMDTETGGTFSVIELDGNPYEVVGDDIPEIQSSYSKARKNALKAQNVETLYQAFSMAIPKEPEVDVLGALTMAGEKAASSEGEKQIIMIDNGVLTTGVIEGKTMFTAEVSWIVDELKKKNCIPNLEGVEVTWIGLGDLSSGEQKELPEGVKRDLKDKWKTIIEAGGGHVEFVSVLSKMERSDEAGMPKVTGIDPPDLETIHYEEGNEIDIEKATVIGEDKLMFEPDSAELIRNEASEEVISSIVSAMKESPATKILVAGSVAGDSENAWGEKLSRMRAETIKSLLVAAGIEGNRIKAIGLSTHSPWRIDGLGIGPEATPNRHVVIIDLSSKTARDLLKE